MADITAVCGRCGTQMQCPESDRGKVVRCDICGHGVAVALSTLSLPKNIEVHADERDVITGDLKEAPAAASAQNLPAAPPTQPKDPDKALTNVALGLLRVNGWPCQEDPGYRSFVLTVKFRSPARGLIGADNFRVYARDGIIYFDTLILELPSLPSVPVLETLNEINQRAVSSVMFLSEEGVIMRHALIPRARDEGYCSAKMMVQTVRQMFHDRTHALSLLRQVVEDSNLDPVVIARVFAQPSAGNAIASPSLDELADLAGLAGYYAYKLPKEIVLHREMTQPDKCAVHFSALPGFIRGWSVVSDLGKKEWWQFVPSAMRRVVKSVQATTKTSADYERINALNQVPGALRYVIAQHNIVVLGTLFPTDQPITAEQFRGLAEILLRHC